MWTREENELLTRVGPGTPAGELLRRYWHPVAVAGELSEEKPIKAVKILGEELVVFQDRNGRYGLVGERCPHRSASLAFGRVDEEGIRCPYHGWKFDLGGRCIEQPAESAGSTFKHRIRHTAYPVQKLGGLLFAYLGPEPRPLLPRWDVLVWEDGKRWILKESIIDCNWLQPMADYQETHEFIIFDHGIMKKRTTPGKNPGDPPLVDEHPLVFPTILRHVARYKGGGYRHNLQIRVPVDDTHTQVFRVNFVPSPTEKSPADREPPFEYSLLKSGERQYNMNIVSAQDSMAWETQGRVTDRTREHLGVADEGVIKKAAIR